ncbi:MAG: class I tRNA ligase family protein [Spirochaetes bacterium]|nr:class I tRNA ligase family protein [Spirochaetota bacterium]
MLMLYNTMTRRKEAFVPRDPSAATIFTCGPSIYQRPHIGNYRTFMYEDILQKYLEYRGYKVDRAMPLTDIEDKTILEAVKKGEHIDIITGSVEKIFLEEAKKLKIRLPKKTARSSACVDSAVRLIERLIDTGHAYWHNGDVFFDPLTHKGFGRLYGLDMKQWPRRKARFRRDTYRGNRWNRGDFILWHGYREGDISTWGTRIGKGRPSWNIQDPSIIIRHLGGEIDINCGGIDNIYRHHDYNIAIMESYTGRAFANYYMHGEHLIVNGKPMSKSRGNIVYPEDIFRRKFAAPELRFYLFYTHYRSRLNYTPDRFKKSSALIADFRSIAHELTGYPGKGKSRNPEIASHITALRREFDDAMDDDLDAGTAFDAMYRILKKLIGLKNGFTAADTKSLSSTLKNIDEVFGVIF